LVGVGVSAIEVFTAVSGNAAAGASGDATLSFLVDGAFFGTAGMIGTASTVEVRVCDPVVVVPVEARTDGTADEGIVGCEESASDGAREVTGVSVSEGPANVDACDSVCSSMTSGITSSLPTCSLDGSSRGILALWVLLRLRLRAGLLGYVSNDSECQGRSG